ncbi:hypothetical protein WJX84_002915 [Apatococcus fuscideae]|uniref:Uncharacterized protein n=1 Tax=Apatococcus fuscideae TaxID=2026836 RepID=A0AAW1TFN6_9CHLO
MESGLPQSVALVTGANSGLGRETAAALAGQGYKVVLACRNMDTGREAEAWIRLQHPGCDVQLGPKLDMSSLASIRNFAARFKEQKWPLNVLVNNAGANYKKRWFTPEGIVGLCQTNYLGPFALTRLLEPELVAAAPSRVVNVSSIMHRFTRLSSAEGFLRDFKSGGAYNDTKLGNVLFAYEHHRRMAKYGVQSCAVDPGAVSTGVWRHSPLAQGPLRWLMDCVYAPPRDGAQAVIHAATAPLDARFPVRPRGMAGGPGQEPQSHQSVPPDQLKFWARGLFSSPLLTWYTPSPGPLGLACRGLWGVSALLHSFLDYPTRQLSGGKLASRTVATWSQPQSYDEKLAKDLWNLSSDVVGVSRDPILGQQSPS